MFILCEGLFVDRIFEVDTSLVLLTGKPAVFDDMRDISSQTKSTPCLSLPIYTANTKVLKSQSTDDQSRNVYTLE